MTTAVPGAPRFTILPYLGVSGLRFGHDETDIRGLLGSPLRTLRRSGVTFLEYACLTAILGETGLLREVSLVPGECRAEVADRAILDIGPQGATLDLQTLLSLDPEPTEELGFLVFFDLGIWTTGFHDGDEAQLSLGAFARGTFDGQRGSRKWRKA